MTTTAATTPGAPHGRHMFAALVQWLQRRYETSTATLISNAATLSTFSAIVTTEALTTAAGGSVALTLTVPGVTAADIAMVQCQGGTSTRYNHHFYAVCSTDTVTVTVYNTEPTNALNGTLIFALKVFKV